MNQETNPINEYGNFLQKVQKFSGLDELELFRNFAERLGKHFADAKITKTQLRAFYDSLKEIAFKLEPAEEEALTDRKIQTMLYLFKAKARYRSARHGRLNSFYKFIAMTVEKIKNKHDMSKFLEFFEAVYAYFYAEAKD